MSCLIVKTELLLHWA